MYRNLVGSIYGISSIKIVHFGVHVFLEETWTDNTTAKRNMDRQYNDQKKHGQTIQRPKEKGQTKQ
jgi:hypothetical protein